MQHNLKLTAFCKAILFPGTALDHVANLSALLQDGKEINDDTMQHSH